MNNFDPVSFILGIVVKGLILGAVLAIAIPFRKFLDHTVRKGIHKVKDMNITIVATEVHASVAK